MPEYLSPGVYVEEVELGVAPIEGVSTSTTGFVGMAARGPTKGSPVLVTSFADYQRQYGGYFDFGSTFDAGRYMPHAVEGFFLNGGKRLYIARVKPADASVASTTAVGGVTTRLRADTATSPPASRRLLRTTSLQGIEKNTTIILRMNKAGVTTDSPLLTVQSIDRSTGEITVNVDISAATVFEARYTTVFTNTNGLDANGALTTLASPTTTRPAAFTIHAQDDGSWGLSVAIQVTRSSAARAEFDSWLSNAAGPPPCTKIKLKTTAGFYTGAWVEVDRGETKFYRPVVAVDGLSITLGGPILAAADFAPQLAAPNNQTILSTCEFNLSAGYGGATEQHQGLTLANLPNRYAQDVVNNGSNLIQLDLSALPAPHPFFFPTGLDGLNIALDANGSDGSALPTDADYVGTDGGPGLRTGIQALIDINDISIIAAPGVTSPIVQNALITQCESLRYRFAILDPAPLPGNQPPGLSDIEKQRQLYDSHYAALYYPRVVMYDPLKQAPLPAPPSGPMAGIYARVDDTRGVHKAPANEVILDVTGLETIVNKAEQDILNPIPLNVNVLRDFRDAGRGLRVWGARCLTTEVEWMYINVRRLFIFLERSLDQGTQALVFEPNNEALWGRARQLVTQFLTSVWRDGALMGTKPEEAFFVRCDRTTMTQDDLDNGRLIMIIGVAPTKPAEFVIIRIGQWQGGGSVQTS